MAEAEQFYRDEIRKRFLAVLDGLDLPADQLSESRKRYLEALEQALDSGLTMTIAHKDIEAFIERLLRRQGTTLPDFAPLYKQKAELDRKLFWP